MDIFIIFTLHLYLFLHFLYYKSIIFNSKKITVGKHFHEESDVYALA